jgi:phosphatidylinositol-3-phosphatase
LPSPPLRDAPTPYARYHNPFAYLRGVVRHPSERRNLVDFSQLATDITDHSLPQYGFIVPNEYHDGHTIDPVTNLDPLAEADQWLQGNIEPLIESADFQSGGLLIITFDEGGDDQHGGGQVATVLVSPQFSKRGYQSPTFFQHQSTLRLMLEGLAVAHYPGAALGAPEMGEFFH